MPAKRTPAPVKLKRLYLCLLALTLMAGLSSLVMVTLSGSRMDALQETAAPGLAWIDEMEAALGETRTSFHRYINSPDTAPPAVSGLVELTEAMKDRPLTFEDTFNRDISEGVRRLSGLSGMTTDVVRRRQWEDLQVIARDFEKVSDQLHLLLKTEKERGLKEVKAQNARHRDRLKWTGMILSLSLLFTILITVGLYMNWRRLERAVLGIDP